jgi:hypothetical protein
MKTKTRIYLSILLIAVVAVPTSIVYAAYTQNTAHFRLEADAGWVDSGFDVQAGEKLPLQPMDNPLRHRKISLERAPSAGRMDKLSYVPISQGHRPVQWMVRHMGHWLEKLGKMESHS